MNLNPVVRTVLADLSQVLDCASPLALSTTSLASADAKVPEDWRSPRSWRAQVTFF